MEIIARGRRSGRTCDLIAWVLEDLDEDRVILTPVNEMVRNIESMAVEHFGRPLPKGRVMTFRHWQRQAKHGRSIPKIALDDLDILLPTLFKEIGLHGVEIITLSGEGPQEIDDLQFEHEPRESLTGKQLARWGGISEGRSSHRTPRYTPVAECVQCCRDEYDDSGVIIEGACEDCRRQL